MPSLVTNKFRIHIAEQFKEMLGEASASVVYMFIGKIQAWADDNNPPTPQDAVANNQFGHWNDMIAMKRTQSTDISHVVNRNDWSTGTVYTEYQHINGDLHSNTFFVMTDDYQVYKCLYNNNGGSSTTKPTGTANTIITTADGYKWKFMYTVSAADAVKFVTGSYIPVDTLTSDDSSVQWDIQQSAVNGSIDVIDVVAGGSTFNNYSTGTLVTVTNTTVQVLAAGASSTDDVYSGSVLYLTGGTGSGQQSEISNYDGSTKTVTLVSAFATLPDTSTTYSVAPKTLIAGDGTGCMAIATMNSTSNTVYSVTVTNAGISYTTGTVTLSANGLSGATANAYIGPRGGHGSDPIEELGGYNVMLNTKFDKAESDVFTTSNDFRKIGILVDPLFANGDPATTSTFDMSTNLTIINPTGSFVADELVTGGTSGATGRLIDANSTVVRLTAASATAFSVAETITGAGGATGNVTIANTGSLMKYSGDILYIEQRSPVSRASDQIEDVKLVVQF